MATKEPKVPQSGFTSVDPASVAPGYVKPGAMSDYCKGGSNQSGEAQQSGRDPYDK